MVMHLKFKLYKTLSPIFIILAVSLSGCVSNPVANDTFGTNVTAKHNQILLSLDPEYPYIKQLDSGLKLRASYRVNGQETSEVVSTSPLRNNIASFNLPSTISNIPDKHICLQIEPISPIRTSQGNIYIIPIRRLNESSSQNSVSFLYPPWESLVKTNSLIKFKSYELAKLEKVSSQYRSSNRSTTSVDECHQERFEKTQLDEPIVKDPAQYDSTARRVCIYRARSLKSILVKNFKLSSNDADDLIANFKIAVLPKSLHSNATQFQKDWRIHSSYVSRESYTPEHGLKSDELHVTSGLINNDSAETILTSAYSQYVDLYDTCVTDTKEQLAKKVIAWNKRKTKQLKEDEEYHQYKIKECVSKLTEKQNKNEKYNKLQSEIKARRAEIQELQNSMVIELYTTDKSLNNLSCIY